MFTRFILLILLTWTACAGVSCAERPNAMHLWPKRTILFLRTADGSELVRKFTESRFAQDPEIAPFLQSLFGQVDEAYRTGDAGEVTGGGLSDLLNICQGEVAFGLVSRSNASPAVLLLADTVSPTDRDAQDALAIADGQERLTTLVEALKAKAAKEGDLAATEPIGSSEVTVFRDGDNQQTRLGLLQRDGVLLLSNDRLLLESVVVKWDEADGLPTPELEQTSPAEEGDAEAQKEQKRIARLRQRYAQSLSENEAYTESLRECVDERIGGGDQGPPNLSAFIDPIGIVRSISQLNNGMKVALATFPVLGLDGLEGGAAAMWIDQGDWDSLIRAHLLLDNPRAGILKLVRLEPCDSTPGKAIPADVATYRCGAIDLGATLDGAGQLYDRIRGEGEFAKVVKTNVTDKIGVSPEAFLSKLSGRFVSFKGYGDTKEGEPMRVTPAQAFLLDTNDPEAVMKMVRTALEKTDSPLDAQTHGGIEYLQAKRDDSSRNIPWSASCLAMIKDQLVLAETDALLHKMIDTHAGMGDRLADHLPFRLTAGRAKRLGTGTVGGSEGRLLNYDDPGSQFRRWHEAGKSDASREQLDQLAENIPPMRWLRDTIDETGIPPLEALLRHASPSGSAVYDTPRGFRFVQFTFKIEE